VNSQTLIIRTCRHILADGRHCQGAAVRGRACCRHHLDARTRLHNMARARRRTVVARLRVPETARDLALNQLEVNRLLATGRIAPDAARMILWAMNLTAATLPSDSNFGRRRVGRTAPNHNGIYDVSVNPLFVRGLSEYLPQLIENTSERGEGGTPSNRSRVSPSFPSSGTGWDE
jgi:hypothetical protein